MVFSACQETYQTIVDQCNWWKNSVVFFIHAILCPKKRDNKKSPALLSWCIKSLFIDRYNVFEEIHKYNLNNRINIIRYVFATIYNLINFKLHVLILPINKISIQCIVILAWCVDYSYSQRGTFVMDDRALQGLASLASWQEQSSVSLGFHQDFQYDFEDDLQMPEGEGNLSLVLS